MNVRAGEYGWDGNEKLAASVKPSALALIWVDGQPMEREIT